MRYTLSLAVASAIAIGAAMTSACASTPDSAVIVNSGSTNVAGYRIEVRSDGGATVETLGHHGMGTPGPAKTFTVDASSAKRFFADLKAARTANLTSSPCMKSASFGTTTHVTWQTWTSPDLDCPSDSAVLTALIRDVAAMREAARIDALPAGASEHDAGPPHIQASPPRRSRQ